MSWLRRIVGLLGVCSLLLASRTHAQSEQTTDESADANETPPDADQGEPALEQGDARPSPFDIAVGLAGFTRNFEYKDDLSGLRSYGLDMGPSLGLKLHWYPAAHCESGPAAQIGLDLRGQTAFALDSAFGGSKFPTSAHAFGLGVRGRLPLGEHELAAVIGYAHQTFAIDDASSKTGKLDPGVPSAAYSFARLGLEARLAFGEFAVAASVAYLPTFSTGEVERMFPNASAAGMEGDVSVSHALSQSFELMATIGVQRFAFDLSPKLSDVKAGRPIAGGALDQYLWGTLGARLVLGR
jgi:hypothetical protein